MKKYITLLFLCSIGIHANVLERYTKACENNEYTKCTNVGFAYTKNSYKGIKVKKDYQKSIYFFKKACDGGDTMGCNNLGMVYKVLKDKENMLKYLNLSCDERKYADSCWYLSLFYHRGFKKSKFGFELKKDKKKSLAYAKAGCDLGNVQCCSQVNRLNPKAFTALEDDDIRIFEATLLHNSSLMPKNTKKSMGSILRSNNQFVKENNFYKVKTNIKIFNRRVYYFGLNGVDFLPGVNVVIDGSPLEVAKEIEKLEGIKFESRENGHVFVHSQSENIKIIIKPHHWENTSYIIAAYVGP